MFVFVHVFRDLNIFVSIFHPPLVLNKNADLILIFEYLSLLLFFLLHVDRLNMIRFVLVNKDKK